MNLQTLIEVHAQGRTSVQLEKDSNGLTNRETINALRGKRGRPMTAFPKPDTIRGLAHALKVTEQTIILATAESLDLCQPDPNSPKGHQPPPNLETEHTKLLEQHWQLKERLYYWQNHATTYRKYRQHFKNLTPIAQHRPWLLAGTQHQANHMQANESR
ncbi:hypothetical protein GCM10027417_24010 [Glutamicibacter endophyticus]